MYYRFLGRIIGKALFDQHLVSSHMVQFLYKHILGWPITLKDLESIDNEYYTQLKNLQNMVKSGVDIASIDLNFTITEGCMGSHQDVDLIPNGSNISLTNDNVNQYLEACLKYRMMDHIKPQLCELLVGFYEVIPEPLLTVFDFQELELLMCGLPNIDIDDWKRNTKYTGEYKHQSYDDYENEDDDNHHDYHHVQQEILFVHEPCRWFWEVVEDEFDHEMKTRLLQFVTGTAGVPSLGFGVLQGMDGSVRQFTIHGIPLADRNSYPKAHTCFNRIDLPYYQTKDDLRQKLLYAVTLYATGFDIQ
jgi:HECT-domain (ubiquitin-transferase)